MNATKTAYDLSAEIPKWISELEIPGYEDSTRAIAMAKEVEAAVVGVWKVEPGQDVPREWIDAPEAEGFVTKYRRLCSLGTQLEAIARCAARNPGILREDPEGLDHQIGERIQEAMGLYPIVTEGLNNHPAVKVGNFLDK